MCALFQNAIAWQRHAACPQFPLPSPRLLSVFLLALTPFNHSSCKKFLMKPGSQHSMLWHLYYVCVYIACKYISDLPSLRSFSSVPHPYIHSTWQELFKNCWQQSFAQLWHRFWARCVFLIKLSDFQVQKGEGGLGEDVITVSQLLLLPCLAHLNSTLCN